APAPCDEPGRLIVSASRYRAGKLRVGCAPAPAAMRASRWGASAFLSASNRQPSMPMTSTFFAGSAATAGQVMAKTATPMAIRDKQAPTRPRSAMPMMKNPVPVGDDKKSKTRRTSRHLTSNLPIFCGDFTDISRTRIVQRCREPFATGSFLLQTESPVAKGSRHLPALDYNKLSFGHGDSPLTFPIRHAFVVPHATEFS